METLAKIALFITILIFPLGQLLRLSFLGVNFPLFDLSLVFLATTNFFLFRKLKLNPSQPYLQLFLSFNLISLIINYLTNGYFSSSSVFYFIRLSSLFSLLIFDTQISSRFTFQNFFKLTVFSSIIFGFLQYFLWPDFTYFNSQNWDPHLHRLVGTFFDPTFTGLIYLFFLLSVYFSKISNKNKYWLISLSYLAIALTYSRSTLLAFFVSFLFIYRRSLKKIIAISLLCLLTVLLLPRKEGEGTKLERTSSILAKIENYQKGISHFQKSPLVGIGYNNIAQSRPDTNPLSHANNGYDSSLLTILVATGIFGFTIFSLATIKILVQSPPYQQTLFIALFVHSLFANSLLYPWTLFYLISQIKNRK